MAGRHKHRETGTSVVIYADNYINDIEGEKLEEMCDAFLEKGFKKIVIDFSGTDLVNSIGVSILIGIIEKIKGKGAVVFSGLKDVNFQIFHIVGLTRHIRVYDNEEDALKESACADGAAL